MKYFLLTYNRREGKLKAIREFPSWQRALALKERFAVEELERTNPNVEVVVLGGESLAAIQKTHARYFVEDSRALLEPA